jgi:hypothetical protein
MSTINFDLIEKQIPIFKTKIPDYELTNAFLKTVILDLQKTEESDHSNVKAWHKLITGHPAFENFISIVENCCQFIFSDFFSDAKIKFKCNDVWIAVYEKDNYTKLHTHFPADFSCIYYVDVEEDAAPLVIEEKMQIKPENGLLVIFPGILDHEVPKTNGRRIVIALNVHKMV